MKDLWPEDLLSDQLIPGPVAILREQAVLLGQKTRNLIEADVRKVAPLESFAASAARTLGLAARRYAFNYAFDLVAPALGDFRYRLFHIRHDVPQYPTMFDLDSEFRDELGLQPGQSGFVEAADENAFVRILELILQSRRTREVIGTLRAQIEHRVPSATA